MKYIKCLGSLFQNKEGTLNSLAGHFKTGHFKKTISYKLNLTGFNVLKRQKDWEIFVMILCYGQVRQVWTFILQLFPVNWLNTFWTKEVANIWAYGVLNCLETLICVKQPSNWNTWTLIFARLTMEFWLSWFRRASL